MAFDPEFKPEPNVDGAADVRFAFETNFMPSPNFYDNPLNRKLRKLAVSVIAKHWKTDIDAFVPYLAMNYFDRFVSSKSEKEYSAVDKVPLVAITCLAIAASMRGIFVDSLLKDIYEDFSYGAIEEMKPPINNKLDHKKNLVTPFSFLNHYYPGFRRIGGFKRRCINEIIVQAQGEDNFIGYTPSEIAFSSFLAATRKAYPRMNLHSIKIQDGMRCCDEELFHLCEKKGIVIEKAGMETTSSSSATAAIRQGKSDELAADEIELERLRRAKGKAVAEPDMISEEEAPNRLMNFHLLWPTDEPVFEKEPTEVPPMDIVHPETTQPESEVVRKNKHCLEVPSCNCCNCNCNIC
ncbi:hypothetical protein RIF29_39252 [Crotalaria pallida]|uniref:B-like cyclin n=1 Tax=Crotalaria pallida TaxID=3830 RepID=A0AAN9E1Q7_CROPI